MKLSSSIVTAGLALVGNVYAQDSGPNVFPIAGPEDIPVGGIINAGGQSPASPVSIAIPPALAATQCAGEVKCGAIPIRVGVPKYSGTITQTKWNTVTEPTTVSVIMTTYSIEVVTTIAAREGLCPIEYENPVDFPDTVTVERNTTTTAWFVDLKTTLKKDTMTIGVTASDPCTNPAQKMSAPTTSVTPVVRPSGDPPQQPIIPSEPVQSPTLPDEPVGAF